MRNEIDKNSIYQGLLDRYRINKFDQYVNDNYCYGH